MMVTTPRRSLPMGLALLAAIGLPACKGSDPESIWAEARSAFEAHQYDRADSAMSRLAVLRAATSDDHMMRAQLMMFHSDVDGALAELSLVPDDYPLAPQARLQSGQLELRRNRARIAERFYLEANRLDPRLIQAHRELIYIYGMQLRRAELAEQFRLLSGLEPLKFDDVFLWCLTRGSTWDPLEVSTTLAKYLEADPDDAASRIALVDSLRQLSRDAEAEERLAPLPDDNPDARAARVRLALDRGDEEKAQALLDGSPRDHLELALLRGRMALARGDTPRAVLAFRDAIAIDPGHRDALFGLAHALQKAGDPEARTYLEASRLQERLGTLVLRASNAGAKVNAPLIRDLGAASAAVGRLAEARSWYAIAIQLNPLDTEAQQALYRLKAADPPA